MHQINMKRRTKNCCYVSLLLQLLLVLRQEVINAYTFSSLSFSSSSLSLLVQQQQHQKQRKNYDHISNSRPQHRQGLSQQHQQNQQVVLYAIKEATFGMGCFWKPSEELLKYNGVKDTIVGYTGNMKTQSKSPTYEQVCFSRDPWVEGVRVVYDDTVLSYNELLDIFFTTQEPKLNSRQYSSVIFVANDNEKQIATKWLNLNQNTIRQRDNIPASITSIEPTCNFYKAEQYHQQYWQKTRPRIGSMILLLIISTGIVDNYVPTIQQIQMLHTTCNGLVLLGLLYVLFERKIDTKTTLL